MKNCKDKNGNLVVLLYKDNSFSMVENICCCFFLESFLKNLLSVLFENDV